ncbi:MAG: hypothetical protein ABGW50_01570 [Thermococcus sp.]
MAEKKIEYLASLPAFDGCSKVYVYIFLENNNMEWTTNEDWNIEIYREGDEIAIKRLPIREDDIELEERYPINEIKRVVIEKCWVCSDCDPNSPECCESFEIKP